MTDVMATGAALRALPAALAVGDDVVHALPEVATAAGRSSARELLGAADARRATELLAIRRPTTSQVDELGDIVQRHARDGADALVTNIDGSPGIVGPLRMQARADLERYAAAWRLQLAEAVEPSAVDARVRDLLATPEVEDGDDLVELDVLVHRFGAAERLGLSTSLDGARPSVRALPSRGTAAERHRYLDTWHAQVGDAGAPERVDARVQALLAAPTWTEATHRALSHLALDLGAAERLGLPRVVGGERVSDVLRATSPTGNPGRVLRAWREQLEHGTDDVAATRERLRSLLGDGGRLDANAIADLRAAAIDLGGARRLGLGHVVGFDPADIMQAAISGAPGASRVMDRLATTWRELLDIDPASLARMDGDAIVAARRVVDGTASQADVDFLRLQLVQRGGAMRLGLPEQLPGMSDSWIGTHGDVSRRRYAQAWTTLVDQPDAADRAATLRSLVLAPTDDPAARDEVRTLALDLGGSFDLGLPTQLAGEHVGQLLDAAALGTADGARLARLDEAWASALRPPLTGPDAVTAARAELAAATSGPLDDAAAGRIMHLILDRDELGLAEHVASDRGRFVEALSSDGRAREPHVAEAIRLRIGMLADTPEGRAVQDQALDQLRGGGALSAVQAQLLIADRAMLHSLRPELRLALLGTTVPSRMVTTKAWLTDVVEAFDALEPNAVPTQLHAQVVELAERNLSRLRGVTPEGAVPGYSTHPDYAELGRIGANAQLAAQMARGSAPRPIAPAPTPSPTTAPTTTEVLTW